MENIYELSARNLLQKIRNKELSVTEVLTAFLNRIDEVNPKINAIHQVQNERILNEAAIADDAIKQGKPLGKLHGLPISIKDTCLISGFKVGKAYPSLYQVAKSDATVVKRLKDAGAIILGVTNAPELLLAYEADNRTYGRTNNPYDLERTPGGSSGGEAALIAAGGSIAGIGSDAGGSVRQPAHYSGICAHKPTQGLVPFTGDIPFDGSAGLINSILSMGPMTKHAEDLSLILEVIAGSDRLDPHIHRDSFIMPSKLDIKQLKVAVYTDNPDAPPCEETVNAVKKAAETLENLGLTVCFDYPKILDPIYKLQWETYMFGGDGGQGLHAFFESCNDNELTPLIKQFMAKAAQCNYSVAEIRQNLVEAEKLRYDLMRWMKDNDYDVVLSPAASTFARKHQTTFDHFYDFNYVRTHNLTHWPATVVPITLSNSGLPIGVQIAARPWDDALCLNVAEALQNRLGTLALPTV